MGDNSSGDDAAKVVIEHLMLTDTFSRWLGIEVVEVRVGHAIVCMTVRDDMTNGFGTAHGGIVFSLADSAFAFAINAVGTLSVAIDCTVSFPAAVRPGDVLTATATEETVSRKLSFCAVTVRNQHNVAVGYFRGTGYRTTIVHEVQS